jgi:uncharacterized protein
MEIVWVILGTVLVVTGIIGCILPVIPGPPIAWLALLVLQLAGSGAPPFDTGTLALWAGLVILVTLLDYIVPVWGTKRFGGTKYGTWGSTIGLIGGLFFAPVGLLAGPFAGAVVGELIGGSEMRKALRAGLGAFIGFLTGVLLKLVVSVWIGVMFFKAAWEIIASLFS